MTEGESYRATKLADPESLLGMLQRGRGKGYLLALESPREEVWPLLFECLTRDPRMDLQIEDRVEYYADLAHVTGMDLEPLRAHIKEWDGRRERIAMHHWLPLAIVACLRDENSRAIDILREYVSYGVEWNWVIPMLYEMDSPKAFEGIDETLRHRIATDPEFKMQFQAEVKDAWEWYCHWDEHSRPECRLVLPVCEPWKTLCEKIPDLATWFQEIDIPYDQPSEPAGTMSEAQVQKLSLREMFALVDEPNRARFARFLSEKVSVEDEEFLLQEISSDNPCCAMLAFRGLGVIATPKAFEAVKSYIEGAENADRRVRAEAYRAIRTMPDQLTLETARRWFRSGKDHLHIPAGFILQQHATLDDVPILIEALRDPRTLADDDFRLMSTLYALANFDGIGPIPELETVFCYVRNSRDRHRAAEAMDITSPLHFQHYYAFECLWDCHYETQSLGCDTVNLAAPGALGRLRELADDDDEDVRQAAQTRLDDF